MPEFLPLLSRPSNATIASVLGVSDSQDKSDKFIDVQQFLSDVQTLAASLPNERYAVNLTENRYWFLVSFCAVIVRGQTNLLPSNKTVAKQHNLLEQYQSTYVIHDGCDVLDSVIDINVNDIDYPTDVTNFFVPTIPSDHLACISFTSGSTGIAKPILKFWRTLFYSSMINARHMIGSEQHTIYQLATVPPQHMWGLETSILLPLFSNVCMSDVKPLYPQDIIDCLNALPTPRMLITTPVHLRALILANIAPARIARVLCATSPLTQEMAQSIESRFSSELQEVYGCSEVGSMALRRTANTRVWKRFSGIQFQHENGVTYASAEHLNETVTLQDSLNFVDSTYFMLDGRASDLVKIAGKRGSLFELNQTLLKYEGLVDGVIFEPKAVYKLNRLSAIVVLRAGYNKTSLLQYLRGHFDSAFVPRPVYLVDALPRESSGKMPKHKLEALFESLRETVEPNLI